jgi:hypothetical protein
VGIVYGIIFVRTGGNGAERLRIKEFASSESGPEHIAVALASVDAAAADTGLGGYVPGSVFGSEGFIGIGAVQVHGCFLLVGVLDLKNGTSGSSS